MTTYIYGASDDLIEVTGDFYDEFNAIDGYGLVAASSGVLLWVTYDQLGNWRISRISGDANLVELTPARGEDAGDDEHGCPGYSDKATLLGDIEWVVYGTARADTRKK